MQTVKEKYWRYSLVVIILALGITICVELTPFMGGLLGAATIYVLLRRQMYRLTEVRKWRRSLAASALLGEAILCFLVPISLIVWMVVNQVQDFALQPNTIVAPLRQVAALLHEKTGYDLLQGENISWLISLIPKAGQWVLGSIADFGINIIVLLFVLYFMLIGGVHMERYCRELLPFSESVGSSVVREVYMIVRSNAIGIPLLAIVQGIIAYIGYWILGAPSPLFWGVLTCFATIIPIVGTTLIWLPLAGYMALTGDWAQAIGLVLYGGLVIANVDNVVRFVMQKKMADTHPLVTVFGVIIGLSLFGFMGVIFGPLLLAMFIFCVNVFKKKFLDETPDCDLFVAPDEVDEKHFKILKRRFFNRK
ncbi:AI-2E family transporter [uncultured Alistipes sp.]|jgi:Predicted permease|uniref:AI-2E family transporter n=1 Tax=uncultured Alistipes sp. TaxID=538949 RepID=UPI0025F67A88|nr:AI-2E family transporter [uncultured Alistipes sp.]